MSKSYYIKFAVSNLKKNAKTVVPFIFTCILSVLMFYNSVNLSLSDTTGTGNLSIIMGACVFLLAIFCTVFLFYTNSFLIRRRKKEFGLYNILGLEKKHIGKIIFVENGIIGAVSTVLGLILGILFSRLLIFALYKIIKFDLHYVFEINIIALISTVALFTLIFILLGISNIVSVYRTNTVDMLKADKKAEKAPKSNIFMLVFGIVTLATGYGIALYIEEIISAIGLFIVAAILVSIGTYCLFSTFGSTVLIALKHNKKFYYKPENFTAVSGLMYRIKKNVAGLTGICILSTGIIVVLATTISMYVGFDDILDYRYSHDIKITVRTEDLAFDEVANIEENIKSEFAGVEDLKQYPHFYFFVSDTGNYSFFTENVDGSLGIDEPDGEKSTLLIAMPESGYKNMTNEDVTLSDNEIILSGSLSETKSFNLLDTNYSVVENYPNLISLLDDYSIYPDAGVIVLSDNEFNLFYEKSGQAQLTHSIYFNLGENPTANRETLSEFTEADRDDIYSMGYTIKSENVDDFYSIYGGFLFVGIFLGTLFLISVLLILYYKQIVEGYEDKENYVIMKKVGMSSKVIKKSVNKQIIFVFLLPIITAIIHIAFAFKPITVILRIFNLINVPLFIMCTIGTISAFFIVYVLMYYFTSKVYHRIVSEK